MNPIVSLKRCNAIGITGYFHFIVIQCQYDVKKIECISDTEIHSNNFYNLDAPLMSSNILLNDNINITACINPQSQSVLFCRKKL